MKLREIREDVDFENEPEQGDREHEDYESRNYDQVFKQVAQHFDLDSEEVDDQDEETKKKVYDMMDKCWDSEDNKVPDSCPIDIDLDDQEDDDQNGDEDDEDR